VTVAGNVIMGSVEGATSGWIDGASIAADFTDHATMNVWPTATSALLGAAADAHAVAVDFNGATRTSPHDAGAYHRTGDANPGWPPGEGFKDEIVPAPDAEATPEAVEPPPDAGTDVTHDPLDEEADDGSRDAGCGCGIVQ
jgi:hypothetical protein